MAKSGGERFPTREFTSGGENEAWKARMRARAEGENELVHEQSATTGGSRVGLAEEIGVASNQRKRSEIKGSVEEIGSRECEGGDRRWEKAITAEGGSSIGARTPNRRAGQREGSLSATVIQKKKEKKT